MVGIRCNTMDSCPGPDDIEEVDCVNEHVGFLLDNIIYRREKIVIYLLFPEVIPSRDRGS